MIVNNNKNYIHSKKKEGEFLKMLLRGSKDFSPSLDCPVVEDYCDKKIKDCHDLTMTVP
jgi:hypothetical protein